MKAKKCRFCASTIPRNFASCPYCFRRQWTGIRIIVIVLVVLFIVAGSYVKLKNRGTDALLGGDSVPGDTRVPQESGDPDAQSPQSSPGNGSR